jgi:hypothetical protein
MTTRPLTCIKCGGPCAVAEDLETTADYGPAVIDSDGTVRPADPTYTPDKADATPLRARACCTNPACRHQWTLRRRFDPVPASA